MIKSPKRLIFLSVFALLIGTAAHAISATVIDTDSEQIVTNISGEIEVVDIPPSLDGGDFTSPTYIRLMHEGSGTVTAGMPDFIYDGAYHDPELPVAPGDNTFGNAVTTPYSGPGLPAVGTEVYSILLHFDPDLYSLPFSLSEGIARSAFITFNRPILGVYVTSGALNTTDDIFTPSGVTFPSTPGRDMEFNYVGNSGGDQYSISPDRNELSLTMYVHNGGVLDEMRIILISAPVNSCQGDIEPPGGDSDVDGSDLAVYISNTTVMSLEDFAAQFGRMDCTQI